MIKKTSHIKNISLLFIIILIITVVFIFSWYYAYETTRVGYISKHLTHLPLGNINREASKIEVKSLYSTQAKIVLDDSTNIDKVINFLYQIEGYKTTDFSHEETFFIDISSPKNNITLMFSRNYICIVKNKNYKSYKINPSYYEDFINLIYKSN